MKYFYRQLCEAQIAVSNSAVAFSAVMNIPEQEICVTVSNKLPSSGDKGWVESDFNDGQNLMPIIAKALFVSQNTMQKMTNMRTAISKDGKKKNSKEGFDLLPTIYQLGSIIDH